jgi:phage gp29-like protein
MASIFSFLRKPTATAASAAAGDQLPSTTNAAGASFGARPLQNPALLAGYAPDTVARILEAAETGEENALAAYFALADKVMEREIHTAAVVNALVLSIAGLPHKAVPKRGDKSKRAQKYADEITDLMHPASPLRLAAPGLISQGLTHGVGVAAIAYDRGAAIWTPVDFIQKPAHFFMFDRADGRTPLLRNVVAGQPARPLVPGEALVFTPRRNSAMQIKNGLAWVLCWMYVIKSLVMADQTLFIQTFGHPLVYGHYPRGTTPEDISLLHRAVNAINSSFRAVFREDLKVKFEQIARTSTDIFEKLIRYLDESTAKFVLGSTLTTDGGGGGTYALGKVHAEGKYDIVRLYAHQYSACLQVWSDAYIALNYGPDAPAPRIVVDVEEAEDLVAKSQIIKNLHDAGVPLVASEIREAFGFSEPQEGDEVIGGATAALPAPAPGPAAAPGAAPNSRQYPGCPEHSPQSVGAPIPRDAIDDLADAMLSDWTTLSADIDANLTAVALSANSLEEMRAKLLEAVNAYDDTALLAMLTMARAKVRLAGDAGAEV